MDRQYLPTTIEGSRVRLVEPTIELAQEMFEFIQEDRERLSRFLPWPPHIKTVDDEIAFIESSHADWTNHKTANFAMFRRPDDS
jgi:ribosomal-protein-serine acetyltransferase